MSGEAKPAARAVALAWCRADLAGGTLDIWPLGLLHRGARTVNVAIGLVAEAALTTRRRGFRVVQAGQVVEAADAAELARSPEAALVGLVAEALELPPCEAALRSDSPRGGGLGASSALTVALIAAGEALAGSPASSPALRGAMARDLEARLMGLPTGLQDHYPALLGGALEIRHLPGGERVRRLEVDLDRLGRSLLVAYTGESHFSAGNNWQIVRRRLEGEEEVAMRLEGIAAVAAELPAALEAGRLEQAGELMSREWELRRGLAEAVSSPAIEKLLAAAFEAGAWGGKACGAGGGGCIAVLCPAERRQAIEERLAEMGARPLAASPVAEPLRLEVTAG